MLLILFLSLLTVSPSASDPTMVVTQTSTSTSTITVTEIIQVTDLTTTVTVSASTTLTESVTIIVPPPSPSSSLPASQTTWSTPAQMTDMSPFNISAFPGTQDNLKIVQSIPASAMATPSPSLELVFDNSTLSIPNTTSLLQLFYPANSMNPAQEPQGGAQFYATPLPSIRDSTNATLSYKVFFPFDFDFVKGGKLPGLYGGHTGCSGGNDALSCFSTRLMWRKDGWGELYLYAPKAAQTTALCDDPQSVCDADYGLSIGRGTFQFARGDWTEVTQNVLLNTPGEQDGGFVLDVNGKRVIERRDVFYRSVPTPTPGILQRQVQSPLQWSPSATTTLTVPLTTTTLAYTSTLYPTLLSIPEQISNRGDDPVGFIGLFFSTFFGGHEQAWATPKDQYVWFKDFSMSLN